MPNTENVSGLLEPVFEKTNDTEAIFSPAATPRPTAKPPTLGSSPPGRQPFPILFLPVRHSNNPSTHHRQPPPPHSPVSSVAAHKLSRVPTHTSGAPPDITSHSDHNTGTLRLLPHCIVLRKTTFSDVFTARSLSL